MAITQVGSTFQAGGGGINVAKTLPMWRGDISLRWPA